MGILNPFYDAVAWVLMRIHALLSVPFGPASGWAWGLSIVFLVMLMRLIMVPLFVKQMHSQRKMAALAPQVAALRKKYKDDKQTMNQEVMKLYQENGANPLAGCLPLVIQLPVFFALFNVLRAIAEDKTNYGLTPAVVCSAQHAHIFTATIADRIVTSPLPPYHLAPGPASAKIVIGIFVLISATTTFLTVRQSVKRGIGQVGQDPNNPMANSQKYMMYIAPLFALSGLYWQFGLVLYWVHDERVDAGPAVHPVPELHPGDSRRGCRQCDGPGQGGGRSRRHHGVQGGGAEEHGAGKRGQERLSEGDGQGHAAQECRGEECRCLEGSRVGRHGDGIRLGSCARQERQRTYREEQRRSRRSGRERQGRPEGRRRSAFAGKPAALGWLRAGALEPAGGQERRWNAERHRAPRPQPEQAGAGQI